MQVTKAANTALETNRPLMLSAPPEEPQPHQEIRECTNKENAEKIMLQAYSSGIRFLPE